MTHTPAPWFAEPQGKRNWIVKSDDYGTIVHRNCYPDENVDRSVEADARLIATAPDLLAALKETLEAIEIVTPDAPEPLPDSVIAKARAAVAKAEGRAE